MKKQFQVRTIILAVSLLLQLSILCFHSHGAAGDVDLSFDPGSGINGPVRALAVQPDGKVIIGGGFTSVKGVVCQNIARLNADGSGDSSFAYAGPNTGVSDVRAIALQSDGKVLVAHDNGLSRFNSNGGLDTGFMIPTISDYGLIATGLNTVALQPDGKILIGGAFRIVNTKLRSGIARLNADGTLDDTFIPATIDEFYTGAFSIAVQPDGKVLIGGQWVTARDVSIARLNADGSLDGSFRAQTDGAVWAVGLQPDGKVLIGGFFASVNEVPRAGFARLGADGATDTAFIPGAAASGTTQAIAVQPDGKIVTGRYALTATGSKLTRMNTDGSVDTTFETVPGSEPAIFALAVQADGKVLAGGADLVGSHTIANYHLLTRFHADGSRDGTFVAGGGVEGHVFSVVSQPDGKVLIGGQFVYINGTRRSLIARLNADGSLDSTFNPASGGYPIVLQPDGKVLFGTTRLHADGSLDGSFNADTGAIGQVYSTALQPDGRIFIGGEFDTVNGIARKNLARLNSDGSLDRTFTPNMGNYGKIKSIAVQPDGKVLVAGKFMIAEDPNIYVLCRFLANGSLDGSFPHKVATDFSEELYNVLLRSDGKILIGGIFRVDGWVAPGLVRLHSDGSVDGTFNPGPETEIRTGTWAGGIALQPGGKVLVAGGFYRRDNEEAISGAFRLNANGSLDGTFNTGTGYNPGANVLVLQSDGKVLVAGSFLAINGVFRQSVARLSGDFSEPPASPEIAVVQLTGSDLVDGASSVSFGSIAPGNASDLTFTVRSLGLAELTGLAISIDGANASAFAVTVAPAGSIAGPNGSSTFTVRFTAASRGTSNAALHLTSNDEDESPFDFALTGASANAAPLAAADQASTPYLTAVDVDVLANDSDLEGDALTIVNASGGFYGNTEIVATANGQRIRYSPLFGFFGDDTFSYTIIDGFGGSATTSVAMTVNPPPAPVSTTRYSKGQTVPGAGDPASGVPAGATWKTFGVPSLAGNGRVAFAGTIGTPSGMVPVVYMGNSGDQEAAGLPEYLLAKNGDLAPGATGARFASFKEPLLNNDGTAVVLATVSGGRAIANSGIWRRYDEPGGAIALVALAGAQPTGVPPGARWKTFTSVAMSDGNPGDETIAFTASMAGNVHPTNDTGLWLARETGVTLALREGATVTVGETTKKVRVLVALQPVAGAGGQGHGATAAGVLVRVKFHDGSSGLLRVVLDNGAPQITAVALTGDEVGGLTLRSFGLPAQSSNGLAAFTAVVSRVPRSFGNAIFRHNGVDLELLAEEGNQPIDGDNAYLSSFTSLANDSTGRVAFAARLKGFGVLPGNDTAMFLRDATGTQLIAREDAQPPGVPDGAKWATFPSLALPDGSVGPIFIGKLLVPAPGKPNPAGITAANNLGVWAVDPAGAVQLIVRTGAAFDAQRKITALALLTVVPNSAAQARSYTDSGGLICRATLNDGSQHIVAVRLQ